MKIHIINRRAIIAAIGISAITACQPKISDVSSSKKGFGSVEKWDPSLDEIIDSNEKLTALADGFSWSEGPAWDAKRQRLYFSDVPANTAFIWSEKNGLEIFRKPSGLESGDGTNGLLMGNDGRLLTANHGKRAITAINLDEGTDEILADNNNGKKFNSPNDLIEAQDGTIYFTDPPYGLKEGDDSPLKELNINGVYKRSPDGKITIVDESLTRPNGIVLSPDQKTLYVAQSDADAQIIKYYSIDGENIADKGIFYDATPLAADDAPGLPDGMCVAETGHIFATGPGGVLILSPDGKLLGRILAEKATANCAFGDDGKTLYLTSSDRLARISLKVKGLGNY